MIGMKKALIAGKDENICGSILSCIHWDTLGYETVHLAIGEKMAVSLMNAYDYDVFCAEINDFPWKRLYGKLQDLSGKVDLILLGDDTAENIKMAFEAKATGFVALGENKKDKLTKILDEIHQRRQIAQNIAQFIDGSSGEEQILYQLNGNNVVYFENLFAELLNSSEDKAIIKAVCIKLGGIIYDYLESRGFKNVGLQRSATIRKIKEMRRISDIVNYVKERYINIFQFEAERNQDYYFTLTEGIKEYILNNYSGESLGVPKIAERFHFSANYVNGIFKSQTGETIPSFISNLRLNKAKNLLAETKMPIGDIALEVGYSRLTYFSRIFKKKYNISPMEYRNKFSSKT